MYLPKKLLDKINEIAKQHCPVNGKRQDSYRQALECLCHLMYNAHYSELSSTWMRNTFSRRTASSIIEDLKTNNIATASKSYKVGKVAKRYTLNDEYLCGIDVEFDLINNPYFQTIAEQNKSAIKDIPSVNARLQAELQAQITSDDKEIRNKLKNHWQTYKYNRLYTTFSCLK